MIKNVLILMSLIFVNTASSESVFAQGVRASWEGKTAYNKVNLKAQYYPKNDFYKMYSTGYFGVPELFPINTKFKILSVEDELIVLKPDGKSELRIEYIRKHTGDEAAWMSDHFSLEPVKLSAKLTKREKELIASGDYEAGMSRDALFLSIGYPPKSLTANRGAPILTYEKKRFNKIVFNFNDANQVSRIKD